MTTDSETSALALILQSYADQDDFPEAYNIKMVKQYLGLAAARVERLEAVARRAKEYMDKRGKPYETAAQRLLRKELDQLYK